MNTKILQTFHNRTNQKPVNDANLIEFFAILHRVDVRTKQEQREKRDEEKIEGLTQ
jgi:hypothetical protein